jgi:uncharacterized protein with PQ loop repeat
MVDAPPITTASCLHTGVSQGVCFFLAGAPQIGVHPPVGLRWSPSFVNEQSEKHVVSMTVGVVGFLASSMSLVLWWPQAATVWKYRNDPARLDGVSRLAQYLLAINGAAWLVYADLTHSPWLAVSVSTNIPLAILTLMILSRAARSAWTSVDADVSASVAHSGELVLTRA